MKLMQATIGKFDGKTIGDYVIHYYIDVESLSRHYCVYDENSMQIIDIDSRKRYRVLKRNNGGTLDKSEASKIKFYEEYALYLYDINFNRMTQLEKMTLMLKFYKTLLELKLKENIKVEEVDNKNDKTKKIIYLNEYKKK